jgi:hypothetical protein
MEPVRTGNFGEFRAKLRAGAAQPRHHGSDGDFENPAGLLVGKLLYVHEQNHLPELLREAIEG